MNKCLRRETKKNSTVPTSQNKNDCGGKTQHNTTHTLPLLSYKRAARSAASANSIANAGAAIDDADANKIVPGEPGELGDGATVEPGEVAGVAGAGMARPGVTSEKPCSCTHTSPVEVLICGT